MDYLQYFQVYHIQYYIQHVSFKPCYKWITFNTIFWQGEPNSKKGFKPCYKWITFNTEISRSKLAGRCLCFKPCYKWITFNTKQQEKEMKINLEEVLNLVINGLPSIPNIRYRNERYYIFYVLNLVINGLPSIPLLKVSMPYLWQKEVIFIWQQKLYIFPYFEDFKDFILIFYYTFFTFLLNSEHFIF